MQVLALVAALGAAVMFFFDPASGRRRRALLRDRTAGMARRRARAAARTGRAVGAEVYGVAQKATHLREEPKGDLDDNTLRAKVETELFRDPDVPKGQINVNAQNGVIQLRGEVEHPEMIRELVEKARKVQGVEDVENLLHLPKTAAPMHQ
jgi:osmotically-inducible protein OsmY